MRLIRTFHTVGQGAFYSEEMESDGKRVFRMVYDCGSLTLNKSDLKKRIKSDFADDLDVDVLFISHFDKDHISGIENLKPKVVILPFLTDDQIRLLEIYNEVVGDDYDIRLAVNPVSVFNDARIIRVEPVDGEPNDEAEETTVINIGDEGDHAGLTESIKSRTRVLFSGMKAVWEYIPYNPNWDKYVLEFKSKLRAKGLDWNKLTASANAEYIRVHFKDLKKIYSDLKYKNEHSLVVYSNPVAETGIHGYLQEQSLCCGWPCRFRHDIPFGCLYFGDITIEDKWREPFYAFLKKTGRLSRIGTIQIPHHGSYLSHGEKVYSTTYPFDNLILCIISVGELNPFGHPSLHVIKELQRNNGIVIMVTEAVSSVCSYYSYCP